MVEELPGSNPSLMYPFPNLFGGKPLLKLLGCRKIIFTYLLRLESKNNGKLSEVSPFTGWIQMH